MIDNMKLGEIVIYGIGGLASLGITTTVSTWVAMQVKQNMDKKKSEREWKEGGKDRRSGDCQEIKENLRQADMKFRSIFDVYVPKVEMHDVEIAVLKSRFDNIMDALNDIKKELRNGHGK